MRNIILLALFVLLGVGLFACFAQRQPNTANNATIAGDVSTVGLTVQAQNGGTAVNTVGQSINFLYVVKKYRHHRPRWSRDRDGR